MHRRGLLTLGVVSAAALTLGGGALALFEPGLRDGHLAQSGRTVFRAISRALLDGSLPAGEGASGRAVDDLLERIDALVAALPPHSQSELSQLIALLSSAPGRRLLAGLEVSWERAAIADIQQALQSMRVSSLDLRRQSYQGLHEIIGSAYFSDPGTWNFLGYPGPLKI